ncbi:DUF7342 family protein [Streptomyces triticiradicis]|uniref:Transcriptional regulatory protein n=1 Tax=Streptomyces triticiradicis TaxID=2651189 RepID=A0A7J5D5U5_9ACTN|nr:response regulator [Streptomyces triticiradicis]KAB1979140.1 response regulator [Streptomyces triticiradicis]
MIDVLVVDDDFHVAGVNCAYVERVPGFRVAARAHTAGEALAAVERGGIDLILLDQYLPDQTGLRLVQRLRQREHPVDVVMVSAARDAGLARAARRHGVMDYLVKPFGFPALRAKLEAYAALHSMLDGADELEQDGLDSVFGARGNSTAPASRNHSGPTTELIRRVLREAQRPLSAQEVADRANVSRSTAQRYLKRLEEQGGAWLSLKYGDAGRPEHHYGLRTVSAERAE